MSLINFILNFFRIRNINKTITKDKQNIIFHISALYHFEIIENLVVEFNKTNNFHIIIAIDDYNETSLKFLKNFSDTIIPTKLVYHLKNISFLIKTSYEIKKPSKSKSILIFHGLPVKNTSINKNYLKDIDYYFLKSDLEHKIYKYISNNAISESKIYKIGYTKLDPLFDKNYQVKLKYKKRDKNIVYAPSWDEGTSLRTHGTQFIKDIASDYSNFNVFVKPHPALLENKYSKNYNFYTGGVEWEKELKNIVKEKANIYFIKYNLIDLIKISDLLITDISGAAIEFLYFNKKVIFIDSPDFYEKTQKKRGFNHKLSKENIMFNSGRDFGYVVENIKDLNHAINNSINDQSNNNFSKLYPYYNEGTATQKAVKTILDLSK